MNRRVLCVLLSALILISLLPNAAFRVNAYEDLTTSDACIDILKDMEGFLKYPKYDNGQYSIGYGSGCNPADYPNGITEQEAEELLRTYLTTFEKSVNNLAKRYGFSFTQNEFDAMVLFTYNVGGNWVNSDGEFRQAVISRARGNDFIYPFCLWSNIGGELNINLVKRRLVEADMYLNGSYTNELPANYTYVVYENMGGIGDVKVQGFDSNLPATVKPIPTLSGYRFLGWYTEETGGSWITSLTAARGGTTLYAHWQKGSGNMSTGTAAGYYRNANQLGSESVYEAPGGKVVGTVASGTTMKIVADYVDSSNIKWGKREDGTWVNLGNPLVGVVSSGASATQVTVTASGVNVRSGPGVTYGIVAGVTAGDKLSITETRMNGTDVWGKFTKGWVCLRYTTYTQTSQDTTNPDSGNIPAEVIATGSVSADGLNIRSGAGGSYPVVGSLKSGDKVYITQKKTVNGNEWGKISQGWISLSYVKLDAAGSQSGQGTANGGTQTGNNSSASGTVNGTVTTTLNIRSGAGTQHAIIGVYNSGTKVTILEQKTVNGTTWGKTDKGWICMTYVKLGGTVGNTGNTTGGNTTGNTTGSNTTGNTTGGSTTDGTTGGTTGGTNGGTTTNPVTGTISTATTGLNVRSGAGTNFGVVGGYKSGDKVTILEQKTVNGVTWGKTNKGWISLAYVKLDTANGGTTAGGNTTDGNTTGGNTTGGNTTGGNTTGGNTIGSSITGTISSNTGLNVRYGAGTQYAVVGSYQPGDKVAILEQKTVNGVTWGKTDKGWISLAYVKLNTTTGTTTGTTTTTGGVSGTVTAQAGLVIRKGPGSNYASVGGYYYNTKIVILEQYKVDGVAWGRTDKGWVCLSFVKLATATQTTTPETTTPEAEQKPTTGTGTATGNTTGNQAGNGVVISNTPLNIRKAPGTNNAQIGAYPKGTRITILQQITVNGVVWGQTDKGWVCMQYVQLDSAANANYVATVTASSLAIRSKAGMDSTVLDYYTSGAKVTILQSTFVAGVEWGRTDKGWICLAYVQK